MKPVQTVSVPTDKKSLWILYKSSKHWMLLFRHLCIQKNRRFLFRFIFKTSARIQAEGTCSPGAMMQADAYQTMHNFQWYNMTDDRIMTNDRVPFCQHKVSISEMNWTQHQHATQGNIQEHSVQLTIWMHKCTIFSWCSLLKYSVTLIGRKQ